jgi:two-component system cell cycle response regulator DivK
MTTVPDRPEPSSQPVIFTDPHVIVVEDNANNLLILLKLLKLIGVERVNWHTSGQQVVQFVHAMSQANIQGRPDLILLDIGLPGEDGYAVLAQLRADPSLRHTRVAAVTVHNSPDEVRRAQAAGFDGFIGKPIDAERFPDQIRRILAGEDVWEP